MNLRPFKFYRVYLDAFNLSNEGDYSWSLILKDFIQVQKERGKFVVVCSRIPEVSRRSRAVDVKGMY